MPPQPAEKAPTALTPDLPAEADAGAGAGGDADDALAAAFARGDQAAAAQLVARHAGRLTAVAARLLGDPAEAEDVAQETMLRLWRTAAKWRPGEAKLSTWLHRVAVNLCTDRLRRRRGPGAGVALDQAPEPEDESPTVQRRLEQRDAQSALAAAMDALPERQRTALALRHYEELGNPQIAEIMEISVEAVESLLSRGRRALKAALIPRRDDLLRD